LDINLLTSFLTNPIVWGAMVILYIIKKGVFFVPQNRGYVVYTLGKYTKTLTSGANFIFPLIQSIEADVNLKEQSLEVLSQSAITKDNITLEIDGVLFMKVIDAASATNNITDYKSSVIQLAMTSMRNAIGSMELDDCFQNRDYINGAILKVMDEATEPWGVKITRFEVRDITPPDSIKDDMKKQMSAEREKRSVILTAQGIKLSEIAKAEGQRESVILIAEGEKREKVLAAEAEKEVRILVGTGEAKAIELVAAAQAMAIAIIGETASTESGRAGLQYQLGKDAIDAHRAIASEGTVILTDGKTSDNIGSTIAQALAVSTTMSKVDI
jgi:regulator of protease activity HflC (stomatin/prohibitin superfamily)